MKNNEDVTMVVVYEDGQPCNHKGCLNHITHPCEGCGRIAGQGDVKLPKWLIENWKKQKD